MFCPFPPLMPNLHYFAMFFLRNTSKQSKHRQAHNDGQLSCSCSLYEQNFQEEMALQPDGSQWLRWSLEQVAFILGRRFPGRYIWVVRASHMYLHKFSCYNNFVESNVFGAPEHSPNYGAFRHLRQSEKYLATAPDPAETHCCHPRKKTAHYHYFVILLGYDVIVSRFYVIIFRLYLSHKA